MRNTRPTNDFQISGFAKETGGLHLDNDLMYTELSSDYSRSLNRLAKIHFDIQLNEICIILILRGELYITLDYVPYRFGENTLLEISPFNIINTSHVSDDFHSCVVIASHKFINETLLDKKPVPISHMLNLRKQPGISLGREETDRIKACIRGIKYYLEASRHRFQKELLRTVFYVLILEVANIIVSQERVEDLPRPVSRKEILLRQFIFLLHEHGRKEHAPAFYSDKMCISVQYLSLILKEISGQTANTWIAGYIVTEAKKLLRSQHNSVQQVAEHLCFSDQSSFGKFFKKHVGISPKRYKEEYASE